MIIQTYWPFEVFLDENYRDAISNLGHCMQSACMRCLYVFFKYKKVNLNHFQLNPYNLPLQSRRFLTAATERNL